MPNEREKLIKVLRLRVVEGKKAAAEDEIDKAVRTIATQRGGKGPKHGATFDGKQFAVEGVDIGNTASVRVGPAARGAGTLLYEARSHGNDVTTYRRGPWVERAKKKAEEICDRLAALRRSREDDELKTEAEKFTPYTDDSSAASSEDEADE